MSTLKETVRRPLREARVDPEIGVISNVKIAGRHSRNGRIYLAPAFEEALDLYRDAPVRVDHGKKGKGPSFDETIAVVKAPKAKNSGLFGSLHIVDRGDRGKKLLALAESAPSVFGLSHEAAGQVQRDRDGNDKVRKITEVHGVALVGSPATTSGLFEADTSAAELVESVRETREPDLAEVKAALFSEESAPPPQEIMEEVAESAPAGGEADLAEIRDRLFT